MHSPRNVLVTGAAGFIGSNFVHHLLAQDAAVQVVSLDALTYAGNRQNLEGLPDALTYAGNRQNLEGLPDAARHVFVHGDICDAALVDTLLRQHRIDTVVHFAAESHVDRSISGPGEFVRTNVTGTFTLLQACRQYWQVEAALGNASVRFHHISTDEVFGTLGPADPAFTESTPYAPNSPYSASKAASDHLVRAWFHTFGLPVVTTNCSNNFGPRQHGEKLIPTIIRSCLKGQPIPVYGDGSNVRDWLYVTDHCVGIEAVLRNGRLGECYNIGGGNEQHNLDVVRLICKVMDTERPEGAPHERLISFVTDRPGHDWRYAIDASKIQQELGWVRAQRFEAEIGETVRWYLRTSAE